MWELRCEQVLRDFQNQDGNNYDVGVVHEGQVVHQFGLPNEHTALAPRNMRSSAGECIASNMRLSHADLIVMLTSWFDPDLVGIGVSGMSAHSAVLLTLDAVGSAFGNEFGGSRKVTCAFALLAQLS